MALNPGSLAQYDRVQPWTRLNAYPDGSASVFDGGAIGVFDDAACGQALTFPRLASTAPAGGFTSETLERVVHFVLNDNKPAATPCTLQRLPRGATSFPRIRPLSHHPSGGGATP
jgi:hypothetical protein